MGRPKKPKEDKAQSTTFSLDSLRQFKLKALMEILNKGKSSIIDKLIDDGYTKYCKQGDKNV